LLLKIPFRKGIHSTNVSRNIKTQNFFEREKEFIATRHKNDAGCITNKFGNNEKSVTKNIKNKKYSPESIRR